MRDLRDPVPPPALPAILVATVALGFGMPSDAETGALLRTLAASKPGGSLLELGTGTGLGTAWLLAGMDAHATLLTVDNDPQVQAVARHHLGHDPRLTIHTRDGGDFLTALVAAGRRFDLIFADTWPGKYTHLDLALALVAPGGLYVVDDMLPQPNWPADHPPKVAALFDALAGLSGFAVTRLDWSTGLVLAVRHA